MNLTQKEIGLLLGGLSLLTKHGNTTPLLKKNIKKLLVKLICSANIPKA